MGSPSGSASAEGRMRRSLRFARSGPQPRPLLPELQSLGRGGAVLVRQDRAERPPEARCHEVLYVRRGAEEYSIAGRFLRIGAGEILIAGPHHDIVHTGAGMPLAELYWLALRVDTTDGSTRAVIDAALDRHALRVIRARQPLSTLFDRLLAEHRDADTHSPWAARGALRCLLAEILRSYDTAPPDGSLPAPSAAVAAALVIMEEHLAEKFPVAQLAAAVQLSPGRFHDRFRAETGYTPAEYWSRRRVQQAREMLADDSRSINDIARALGFSTSQYFATFFRRFTGLSPSAHRHQLRRR
jgi:AraC-like DNA-binding protein